MINVLYVTYASDNFDGATYSLMDLIESVKGYVYPIVMLRTYGCVYEYFRHHGIECIVCDFQEDLVHIPITLRQYARNIINYVPSIIKYRRRNISCVNSIYNRLKGRDIRIVHTNNTVMSVGYDIARKLHAKHVWHLRGFMDLGLGWMPLRGWRCYKNNLSQSDAVIGITSSVLEHYISPERTNAYTLFDAVRSCNDACYYSPKEKYFLFCAGFLTRKKGCDFAIKAFAKSGLAKEGYRLRIIGEANETYSEELNYLLKNLSLLDYVDFIGRVNNVKEHMMRATAFMMCSEYEGLGRVSVEAMFYGCLVIGRNSGGTKDFIFNEKTGFLFQNIESCVEAMRKAVLCDNQKIILRAQEYACSNFAIEDYGKKIISIYNDIIV